MYPTSCPAKLEGVWLKVQRGQEHIEAYEDLVDVLRKAQPYEFFPECDLDTHDKIWRVRGEPKTPTSRVSVIVGDSIQNMRSALDHLAWQLVLQAGNTPDNRTAFPLESWPKAYRKRAPSKLDGMTPEMKAMVKATQPCYGVNPYINKVLGWLEDLNNIDKHRRLHLTFAGAIGGMWVPGLPMNASGEVMIYEGPVEDGTILARVPEKHMDVEFGPFFDVTLPAGGPAAGERVLSVLIGIREMVRRVIERFTTEFF